MTKKLGRPADTPSEQTRRRILDAARLCFAQHGYEATTNRQLAEVAQLTTGAIYHYFGSKRELYIETHRQVQELVYRRFEEATDQAGETFVDRIAAVLDEAATLNREDPSLAAFLLSVRIDMKREEDLKVEYTLQPTRRQDFFSDLVDLGVRTGEIAPGDRVTTLKVIQALLIGLVTESSGDPETHASAVEGTKRLFAGSLIAQPATPAV